MKKWPSNQTNNTKESLYNAVYGPKNKLLRYFGAYGATKNNKVLKNLEVANSVRNVHLISNKFLNGLNLNKNRWTAADVSTLGPRQKAFKIVKPVPIIAFSKGKYIGHIWREGATPANTGSDTATFIGIQKTLDPTVTIKNFGQILLKETEKELASLGYKKMETYPRDVMAQIMNRAGPGIWKRNSNGFRVKNISNQGN